MTASQKLKKGDRVQLVGGVEGTGYIGTVLNADQWNSILVEYEDRHTHAIWRRWYPRWGLRKQPEVKDDDKTVSTD